MPDPDRMLRGDRRRRRRSTCCAPSRRAAMRTCIRSTAGIMGRSPWTRKYAETADRIWRGAQIHGGVRISRTPCRSCRRPPSTPATRRCCSPSRRR
ncbi:hypothetical protein AB5I41_14060 [Sphingomonas sp. MMS24-JH45]